MAVPKKKMSNSKRNSRKDTWNKKVKKRVKNAISMSKSILSEKYNFVLN